MQFSKINASFPRILNYSFNYCTKKLLSTQRQQFVKAFHEPLLRQYLKFVEQFLKFGLVADPFGEFFVQSKISQFNTEKDGVFYGLNYSCDFSQTYLMQGLFPYFITEQNAREVAVLGRIAAEVR